MGYARSAWRFRWYIHLIAWPLCIGGWVMVYSLPDQYEASARVYVDTQSVLRPLLKGLAVQTDSAKEVAIMTRTLLSRPNLEKVARMTDMDLGATTPEEMEGLLNRLEQTVTLTGRGRDNLYTITYIDKEPELAKQVVQSLLTIFVETSLGDTRKDTDIAQRFLDGQIEEYETRLFSAEEALKEFKRENVGMMPREGQEYYQQMQGAIAKLSAAQLELSETVRRRDELRRQLLGEEPTFGMVPQTPAQQATNSALSARIQNLQTRLDELLLQYTDRHPDVAAIKRTIETLEAQKTEELAQVAKLNSPSTAQSAVETNPVYQQLRISLGDAEASVVALQVRVDRFQEDVNRLKTMVNTIPQVEAELKRLNRGYAINKKNYETLLVRRELAKISRDAGQSSENVKFRIIDPPRAPLEPSDPNRPLLVSVVLLGSLLVGVAFAFFLSQLKPSFDSVRTITRELGVPAFGSVSRVWNGHARLKRRAEVLAFGAMGLVLLVLYGFYLAYLLTAKAGI
ncbi:MAG: chain length-determining protein [Gammaproteobacteria bacterium]|nr:chain length-determining protein [Gammaproteobacteria bacterium]MCF6363935.1 chain length-determining protein [Gammaproteobacteria bacterium]